MKTRDLMELASRNLREAVLRNSLTTMGIAVGVASLVAMVSLGAGLQRFAQNKLEGTGLFDRVYVYARSNRPGRGGRGGRGDDGGSPIPVSEMKFVTNTTRDQLKKLPNVVEVFPEVRFTSDLRYGDVGHVYAASSVSQAEKGTGPFDSLQGSFFSAPDAAEVIIHKELAQQIADEAKIQPSTLIGQTVTLRYPRRERVPNTGTSAADMAANDEFEPGYRTIPSQAKVTIVGIVQNEQAGPGGLGGVRILLPLDFVEKLSPVQTSDLRSMMQSPNEEVYASLTVKVNDPKNVTAIEDSVKGMGYAAFSLLDAAHSLQTFFRVLDTFLGIFGSLALAVASLGIINTLVMAILERRREIGVLKALGAADRDVKRLFFAEAGVMGLGGGLFGVFLGWAIGRIINVAANIWLVRQDVQPATIWWVPWWLVAFAIGFSILVSLAAALYPAARAAKLDPVQALRYE